MQKSRRDFIRKTALSTTGISLSASAMGLSAESYRRIMGSNDRINIGVVGVRGQGNGHLKRWASMAKEENVYVKTICDIDRRLFAERVKAVSELQEEDPKTEVDMRKVFADPDIDAVSIATPNHWHALATIWAVQSGKDVYVEKPACHNIFEGRKMIEAGRKYGRIVQVGFQNRSIPQVRQAIQFLHNGGIGEVYMARGTCFKPRDSFGHAPKSAPPAEVDYDLWLGPARWKPFRETMFHYNWHWHWDTGNGDIGNQGPHQFDIARWGLQKDEHPTKIHSSGAYYKWNDCSQETPNTQVASFEYADGKMLQFEVRGLYTGGEAGLDVKIGNLFYGTEGWLEIKGSKWQSYLGRKNELGPGSDAEGGTDQVVGYLAAPGGGGHYKNFISAMRSRNFTDLTCDIYDGYLSSCLPLLANISYRLGGVGLEFNGAREKFVNNSAADDMLTREYRDPFIVREKV